MSANFVHLEDEPISFYIGNLACWVSNASFNIDSATDRRAAPSRGDSPRKHRLPVEGGDLPSPKKRAATSAGKPSSSSGVNPNPVPDETPPPDEQAYQTVNNSPHTQKRPTKQLPVRAKKTAGKSDASTLRITDLSSPHPMDSSAAPSNTLQREIPDVTPGVGSAGPVTGQYFDYEADDEEEQSFFSQTGAVGGESSDQNRGEGSSQAVTRGLRADDIPIRTIRSESPLTDETLLETPSRSRKAAGKAPAKGSRGMGARGARGGRGGGNSNR